MEITMKERYLAIVLLDIIGSTAFVQKVGAVKAAKWFQYHDRLTRSLCYRYEGREIDRSDGFLLSFDLPIDAVNFALHYQREIPPRTKLNTRIGIHWGKVIEVQQDDKFIDAGAKRVELEGIAKNIAARTMSLCGRGQVLLTKDAIKVIRNRTNMHTPKSTRFVCVGMYKFKGVKEPQEIYAVGETIQSLQPPKGGDKVKRLGGPKYIKKRARDRKFMEWFMWAYWRLGIISIILWLYLLYPFIIDPYKRSLIGMPRDIFILDSIVSFVKEAIQFLGEHIK